MIKLSSIKPKKGETNKSYFDRRLNLAEKNYKEARTRLDNESGLEWLDRFDDYEESKEYGKEYILDLRKNIVDTEEDREKREVEFLGCIKKIYDAIDNDILIIMKRKNDESIRTWYERVIFTLEENQEIIFEKRTIDAIDETSAQFQQRITKFIKILTNIEMSLKLDIETAAIKKDLTKEADEKYQAYKQQVDDKSKKDFESYKIDIKNEVKFRKEGEREDAEAQLKLEQEEIENQNREEYNKTLYKGFIIFTGAISLCFFLKLYFITPVLGYLSLTVSLGFIIYIYNSNEVYENINSNKPYKLIMGLIYKFSKILK